MGRSWGRILHVRCQSEWGIVREWLRYFEDPQWWSTCSHVLHNGYTILGGKLLEEGLFDALPLVSGTLGVNLHGLRDKQ